MEYKKIAILKATMLLVLSLFCVTTYAKPEKIKYGKNILYVGETFKFQGEKVPYGQGMLTLFDRDKDIPTIEITGEFHSVVQDSKGMYKIEEASLRSTGMSIRSFSGTINYSIEADKNNSSVLLSFFGEISQTLISVSGKQTTKIGITEFALDFSYDKEQKVWKVQLGNPNCVIDQQPIPTALSDLGYKDEDIQQVVCEVSCYREKISFDNLTFQLKDGGSFLNNKLSFSDGSFFVLNGNKWHGNKKFANGVLNKNENSESCQISYDNGSTYEGTIKTKLNDLIIANEIGEAEYVDGVFASNGTSEKWINGESFTKRHERLTGFLDAELVAAVEDGSLTESAATQKQEELNRQREEDRKSEIVKGIVDDWFAGRNQITFKGKEIGRLAEVSAGIGLAEGDILYDCKLVLNKDGNGTLTYKLSPTESAFYNQRIHYKRYGGKQRHGDFVTDFCNTINSKLGSDSGKWYIDGSKLKFGDYSITISEDRNKIELKIIDYCTLYLVK